ncbi:MAG: Rrf2 family transcriptional regulator, partial [Spirochaetales bacterium]|nr:Rrf2 family transcriptional regulator [Spirochaetales bacterium]
MRVTTKGRYGLRAILELANRGEDTPVSIKAIAEKENLSPEFLEQIFFRLRKAGLISSTRGPGGGFTISLPLEELTIRRIFDAVGEDLSLAPCLRPEEA